MEKANSEDGNRGVKLPIGFRFHPTDEELLVHYLKRKVFSLPLPAAVVPDFNVFQFSPWDMPGELKEKRYFFSKRKMNLMNKKSRVDHHFSTDGGYWRATNNNKDSRQILAPGSNFVIGIKRSYVFYQRKKSLGLVKTRWVMHEFCLVGSISPTPYSTQKIMIQVGDWVVCRVYQRKRKRRNQGRVVDQVVVAGGKKSQNLRISSDKRNSAVLPSSPSPCCSGITEISSDNDELVYY